MNMRASDSLPGADIVEEVRSLLDGAEVAERFACHRAGTRASITVGSHCDQGRMQVSVTCFAYGHRAVDWSPLCVIIDASPGEPGTAGAASSVAHFRPLDQNGQAVFPGLPVTAWRVLAYLRPDRARGVVGASVAPMPSAAGAGSGEGQGPDVSPERGAGGLPDTAEDGGARAVAARGPVKRSGAPLRTRGGVRPPAGDALRTRGTATTQGQPAQCAFGPIVVTTTRLGGGGLRVEFEGSPRLRASPLVGLCLIDRATGRILSRIEVELRRDDGRAPWRATHELAAAPVIPYDLVCRLHPEAT